MPLVMAYFMLWFSGVVFWTCILIILVKTGVL
jgi:hypothetical protein